MQTIEIEIKKPIEKETAQWGDLEAVCYFERRKKGAFCAFPFISREDEKTRGYCVYHFPKARGFNSDELRKMLLEIQIQMDPGGRVEDVWPLPYKMADTIERAESTLVHLVQMNTHVDFETNPSL